MPPPSTSPRASARALAGRAHRHAVSVLQRLDPTRWALRGPAPEGSVALACVYRRPGVPVLRDLLRQLPAGADVRLWSLDGHVPDDLRAHTRGSGPGTRAALLNRLCAGAEPDVLVLADDDVRLVVGDLTRLLVAGRRLALDVWQPAHLASSHASWDVVRRRSGSVARVGDFVEQGPLLLLSRRGRGVVLPLPEDDGMAWGVEAGWGAAARRGEVRLGIVDAVAVRHLAPPAAAYDRSAAEAAMARRLAEHGLTSLADLHEPRERHGLRSVAGRRG